MPTTSQEQTGSAYSRTNPKHWIGVEAEDIPQGWMDDMAKRIFVVMNRNLIRLETAQSKVNDEDKTSEQIIKETAQHQRLASQIRADMQRLRKLEMKRQSNKPQVTVSDDEARDELKREIDRIIAAETSEGSTSEHNR
jgi:hypothetical protein